VGTYCFIDAIHTCQVGITLTDEEALCNSAQITCLFRVTMIKFKQMILRPRRSDLGMFCPLTGYDNNGSA
jgi:hypothetical protein